MSTKMNTLHSFKLFKKKKILSISYFLSAFLFAPLLPHKENHIICKNKGNFFFGFVLISAKNKGHRVKASPLLPLTINPIRKPSSTDQLIILLRNSIIRMKKREVRGSPDVPLSNSQPKKKKKKKFQGCH